MWKKLMKQCLDQKLKFTKHRLTALELMKLKQRNLGNNDVEHFVKGAADDEAVRDKLRRSVMKIRIDEAKRNEETARNKFERQLNYLQRRWGHNIQIMSQFRSVMQTEVELLWSKLRQDIKEKIEFLTKKWKKKDCTATVDEWEGIAISDKKLHERYDELENIPNENRNNNGIFLDENEKKILELPPNFRTLDRIDIKNVKTAVGVMSSKVRMELRAREERGGEEWSAEEEFEDVKSKTVFDENKKELNFAKQRVTDMQSCRRIITPEQADNKTETILANMEERIVEVTQGHKGRGAAAQPAGVRGG